MRAAIIAVIVGIFLGLPATGEAQGQSVKQATAIPAQELAPALQSLVKERQFQIIYSSELVANRRTQGAKGELTMDEALDQLLEGTGLTYQYVDNGTVAIRAKPTAEASQPAAFRVAQAEGQAASAPQEPSRESETLEEIVVDIPEILVTGSRSLNMDIRRTADDVQPYVVFDRQDLEKSSSHSVEDFLKTRMLASGTSLTSEQLASPAGGQSQISLRGMDIGETLILVDGHRKGRWNLSGRPQQGDLNGIPLSAVERIEVLATTASGIYGGDATGGAINIVLRRDYSGIETKLTYENSFESDVAKRQVDVSAGFNLENGKTNVMLLASYGDANPLLVQERDFQTRAREMVRANNPTAIFAPFVDPILGETTNICAGMDFFGFQTCSGAPLTLKGTGTPVGSSFTFVPVGYDGVDSDGGAGFIDNAGEYNLAPTHNAQDGGGGRNSILNDPTRKSLMLTLRREFTPRVQAFLDLSTSENNNHFVRSGAFSSTFFVPQTADVNPFEQDVMVTTPAFGTDEAIETTLEDGRVVGGILMKLPRNWQSELDYTWERTRFSGRAARGLDTFAAGGVVAAGVAPGGAPFDVFRDTNEFPVDFSPFLTSRNINEPGDQVLKDASVRFGGPVWALPGGALMLTTLLERRDESVDETRSVGQFGEAIFFARSQTVDSVYMEARVPVVSAQNAMPGIRALELQLAGRWDQYNSLGANSTSPFVPEPETRARNKLSSTNPTVGLRFQPLADLAFRASYNTGFLAPSVGDLVSSSRDSSAAVEGFTDPLRGNEVTPGIIAILTGGNPNLRPEKSDGWTAGVILTPHFAPRLRFSVDWVQIHKTDNIDSLPFFFSAQQFVDAELDIPGLVIRGAPDGGFDVGPIIGINEGLVNIAQQTVEAYDLALDYTLDTSRWGRFELSANATRNMHNRQQTVPGLPEFESVDAVSSSPRWRGVSTLTWDYRNWQLAWTSSYTHGYTLDPLATAPNYPPGTERLASQTYHDLYASYRFDEEDKSNWLSGIQVQLGIKNVFNKEPPIDVSFLRFSSYYSTWADPRLASYSLSIRKAF